MFGMCNKEHKRCLFIVSKIGIIWSNRRTHVFINCLKHLLRLPETHNALQLPVFFFSLSASSPSPHDFASVIRNIGKFGGKNYITDQRTANTICSFRDSLPVLKKHDCYLDTQKIEQHSIPIENSLFHLKSSFRFHDI